MRNLWCKWQLHRNPKYQSWAGSSMLVSGCYLLPACMLCKMPSSGLLENFNRSKAFTLINNNSEYIYMMMKIVSKVVGSCNTSMPIINGEEGYFWSFFFFWIIHWFLHIYNNSYSILILSSYKSDIRVCCIALYDGIRPCWLLWWFKVEFVLGLVFRYAN